MMRTWTLGQTVLYGGLAFLVFSGLSAWFKPKLLTPVASVMSSVLVASENSGIVKVSDTKKLAQGLDRENLEPATRDPFVLEVPPAMAARAIKPVAAPPMVQLAAPVPPPPPLAPALNLRFVGRMTGPEGVQSIYASIGETPVTLSVGQSLSNGYRVDAIKERVVELSYPPLNTTTKLDLPEAPAYEIR